MTKILLGIAIGYVLSDMIDEFLGKKTADEVKVPPYQGKPPETPEPVTPDPASS